MFRKVLSLLGLTHLSENIRGDVRRKHIRHPGLQAEIMVGDRIYSVRDWSLGGVLFETAPDARIQKGDQLQVILKFRFPHDTITIQQQAHILRAEKRGIAAQFAPMPPKARREFDRVLDSLYAQSFLKSQIA